MKLSLTPTLLPGAMWCFMLCTSPVSQQANRRTARGHRSKPGLAIRRNQRKAARPCRDPAGCQSRLCWPSCGPGAGEGAALAPAPGASSGNGASPWALHSPQASSLWLPAISYLNSSRDLSVALFLETRLASSSILSQRHLDSTKWN